MSLEGIDYAGSQRRLGTYDRQVETLLQSQLEQAFDIGILQCHARACCAMPGIARSADYFGNFRRARQGVDYGMATSAAADYEYFHKRFKLSVAGLRRISA